MDGVEEPADFIKGQGPDWLLLILGRIRGLTHVAEYKVALDCLFERAVNCLMDVPDTAGG